jgi:hypothetical protein
VIHGAAPLVPLTELDALTSKFPTLPRDLVALTLEAYWPIKSDVERTLHELAASQSSST